MTFFIPLGSQALCPRQIINQKRWNSSFILYFLLQRVGKGPRTLLFYIFGCEGILPPFKGPRGYFWSWEPNFGLNLPANLFPQPNFVFFFLSNPLLQSALPFDQEVALQSPTKPQNSLQEGCLPTMSAYNPQIWQEAEQGGQGASSFPLASFDSFPLCPFFRLKS